MKERERESDRERERKRDRDRERETGGDTQMHRVRRTDRQIGRCVDFIIKYASYPLFLSFKICFFYLHT